MEAYPLVSPSNDLCPNPGNRPGPITAFDAMSPSQNSIAIIGFLKTTRVLLAHSITTDLDY